MTMLEYCKMILVKVSFDPGLFRTELNKAIKELVVDEVLELKKWCIETFGWTYCKTVAPDLIAEPS